MPADVRDREGGNVSEHIPEDVATLIEEVDTFIETDVRPLEAEGDNARFFDHRREYARTDFDAGGIPSGEWEALLEEMVARADRAGLWRYALPDELGGRGGANPHPGRLARPPQPHPTRAPH